MKKLLAFLLVLVMILSISLVACDKKAAISNDSDGDDPWSNGSGSTNNNNNNNGDDNGDEPDDPDPVIPATWVDYTGKLYVGLDNVNLRAQANSSSAVVAQVDFKDELTALRTNNIYYEVVNPNNPDGKCYVLCDLVTANAGELNFATNEKLPVAITFVSGFKTNIRSLPFVYDDDSTSTSTTVFTYGVDTVNGTFTKVAVSENGWWYELKFTGTVTTKNGTKTYTDETLYIKVIGSSFNYTNKINDPSNSGGQGGIG